MFHHPGHGAIWRSTGRDFTAYNRRMRSITSWTHRRYRFGRKCAIKVRKNVIKDRRANARPTSRFCQLIDKLSVKWQKVHVRSICSCSWIYILEEELSRARARRKTFAKQSVKRARICRTLSWSRGRKLIMTIPRTHGSSSNLRISVNELGIPVVILEFVTTGSRLLSHFIIRSYIILLLQFSPLIGQKSKRWMMNEWNFGDQPLE